LAEERSDEMGMSDGISEAERARTRDCDDKRLAASAKAEN